MPKHTVDTSQVQPATGFSLSPKHPSIPDMPPAPGHAKSGVPVPQNDAAKKPVVAGIARSKGQHPAIQEQRVPASHQYQEPPDRVKAADDSMEPSR